VAAIFVTILLMRDETFVELVAKLAEFLQPPKR
jgi:hypothetical protein